MSAVPSPPTAWHVDDPVHATAFSDMPKAKPGAASGDHELPFQRWMIGWGPFVASVPTAKHFDAPAHATPERLAGPTPKIQGGSGVGT